MTVSPTWTTVATAIAVIGLASASANAQTLRFKRIYRQVIEDRLGEYAGTNTERAATLKRMLADAGCGDHLSEQSVRRSSPPNVICVLPGATDRVIIVGAHFDRVYEGQGVVDNWSGASLLPSLYESLKAEPRRHTYVFIGFTEEEKGLVGSRFYARNMTAEQVAATAAMVNLDALGMTPTKVWVNRSDPRLTVALIGVAKLVKLPLEGSNFERVGSTDSESFAARKIPRITIHSLTQKTEDQGILHSSKDKLSAVDLDAYYDTYRLMAVYLAYLDHYLAELAAESTPPG